MSVRLSPERSRRVAALSLATVSLLASSAVGSVFLIAARDAWTAAAAPGPAGPADGILLMTSLGGASLSLWLGLGMTLSALSALPGELGRSCQRLSSRVAPAAVRKAVAFVLGTTLTAALVPGTALGDTAGFGRGAVRPAAVAAAEHTKGGLAVAAPDASLRTVSQRPPARDVSDIRQVGDAAGPRDARDTRDAAPVPAWLVDRSGHPSGGVVVLRADSLWSIAANHLGPAASAADIDAEWHRWHAANRAVIGDDPNLILPGQLLRPPSPRAGS